ncbi:MAG: transposase [Thermomicrobiales bacterium]|nr:transposase [Thermomicrobiales bacterium]MCO5224087.1 transposase [Thermomicrobiales bacterium]
MKRPEDFRPGTTRRVRMKGFDYRTPSYYFVTVCTHNRACLLGSVRNEEMVLNHAGQMIADITHTLTERYPQATTDSFVIMPNHVHLLIGLNLDIHLEEPALSLINVVHWWKTQTTVRYIAGVKLSGWTRFEAHLWQEGYHDHIVRNDRDLETLRIYVAENPARWGKDIYHDGPDW